MNKSEIINALSEKTGFTKTDCAKVLNATVEIFTEALKKGDKVQLIGFGTFSVKSRKAKTGTNPQTHEAIEIPARKSPVFKAGKDLKEAVAAKSKSKGKKK